MEKLKSWHVFDPTDFDGIIIDATKWEESLYSLAFNFYCTKETEEEAQAGFTFCTMILGNSLQECHERIMEVINTGIFDELEIASHGTLWSKDGDEVDTICWNDYDTDDTEETITPPPLLH